MIKILYIDGDFKDMDGGKYPKEYLGCLVINKSQNVRYYYNDGSDFTNFVNIQSREGEHVEFIDILNAYSNHVNIDLIEALHKLKEEIRVSKREDPKLTSISESYYNNEDRKYSLSLSLIKELRAMGFSANDIVLLKKAELI